MVSTLYVDVFNIEEYDDSRERYMPTGTLTIAENNKDVTINGDPKLFLEIANEIEKLGYSVTILY